MRNRRGGERGSIFIIVLLALVLLTVIGLSLALITETEMLIGSNERITTETFYAAEIGVSAAVAQLLIANSMDSQCLASIAKETDGSNRKIGLRTLGYSIDTTTLYPVSFAVAPYSKANQGREDTVYAGFFRGEARALRGSWPESAARPVPREPGEELADIDFEVQASKSNSIAFFSAPLQAFESASLVGAFDHPEVLGCEPHPSHAPPAP